MTEPALPSPSGPDDGPEDGEPTAEEVGAVLATEAFRKPFGPVFFLTQLRAFVRDRCPAPEDRLPVVEVRLVDGAVLDLCHVIGVAPGWVALAVNDEEAQGIERPMRTEFVPYGTILRVTIRPSRVASPGIGFSLAVEPRVLEEPAPRAMSAEAALSAAAGAVPRV